MNFGTIGTALAALPPWGGRILFDTTNLRPMPTVADLGVETASEFVANQVPGARVVKATFHEVADDIGFAPVDAGTLREGGRLMQIGGPLSALHALKQD